MNRSNTLSRIKNDSKISANIHKAILKYFNMKFHKTIVNQENISIFDNNWKIDKISTMIQLNKSLLIYVNKNKGLTICL